MERDHQGNLGWTNAKDKYYTKDSVRSRVANAINSGGHIFFTILLSLSLIAMLYVLFFTISVAFFTITHDIGFLLLIVVLGLSLYRYRFVILSAVYTLLARCGIRQEKDFLHRPIVQDFSGGYLLMAVCAAVMAVVGYDRRMAGSWHKLSDEYLGRTLQHSTKSDNQYRVLEQERSNRYRLDSMSGGSSSFLLYSSKALRAGDVVMSVSQIQWRSYDPELKFFDYDTLFTMFSQFFFRQGGQVIDSPTFDFDRRLYMKGIDGMLYDNFPSVIDHRPGSYISQLRQFFLDKIKRKYDSGQDIVPGLIGGLTVGDRSMISSERYQQFMDSGLVHLIAVSGGNIAIIVLFVGLFLFWLPFYMRQMVLMATIVGYAMLVGDDSSIIRAAVMGLLTIIVLFPGRQLSIWRSLTYARCGMLLRNPYYLVYDMGFLLSFSALAGIIIMEMKINTTIRETTLPRKKNIIITLRNSIYRMYILPTLGATLGVTPLLLWSMTQINLMSLVANIIVIPFIPLLTIAGFILPFVYSWTWFDTLYRWSLQTLIDVSALSKTYGVYLSIAPGWRNLFFLLCLIWWVRQIWIESGKVRK